MAAATVCVPPTADGYCRKLNRFCHFRTRDRGIPLCRDTFGSPCMSFLTLNKQLRAGHSMNLANPDWGCGGRKLWILSLRGQRVALRAACRASKSGLRGGGISDRSRSRFSDLPCSNAGCLQSSSLLEEIRGRSIGRPDGIGTTQQVVPVPARDLHAFGPGGERPDPHSADRTHWRALSVTD